MLYDYCILRQTVIINLTLMRFFRHSVGFTLFYRYIGIGAKKSKNTEVNIWVNTRRNGIILWWLIYTFMHGSIPFLIGLELYMHISMPMLEAVMNNTITSPTIYRGISIQLLYSISYKISKYPKITTWRHFLVFSWASFLK